MKKLLVLCALIAGSAAEGHAQAAKRPLGDTLRLVTTSSIVQDMESSEVGKMNSTIKLYTRMIVTFGPGDTIRTWNDSVTYDMLSSMGNQSPDVSFLVNKVAVGVVNADGSVTVVSVPKLPDELAGFASMMPSAEKTFPIVTSIPKQPLLNGLVWTDTTVVTPDSAADQTVSSRTIARYEVVGDSVINGAPVVIIETATTSDAETDMTLPGGVMTMKGSMKTTGNGRAYYSPDYRMYIMAHQSNSGTNSQVIEGPMSMTVKGTQTTTATTKLQR